MLTTNPFAELSASISPGLMQGYVVVMVLLVVAGTLYDVAHKRSARYFFAEKQKMRAKATREVSLASLAVQTLVVDVATSAEFCNQNRRIAHLLTMYGFVLYALMTAVLVFCYPTPEAAAPGILPLLWYLGALMVCAGGYWFWFFIRVDVAAEGLSPFRLVRADLFIVSLLASVTLAILWGLAQAAGSAACAPYLLGLYLMATTVLFAGIPWSKFAHMFFKPAAALDKREAMANGSALNLPTLSRDDPEQQKRHSMQLLRDAPMDMGLGIKREAPRHY